MPYKVILSVPKHSEHLPRLCEDVLSTPRTTIWQVEVLQNFAEKCVFFENICILPLGSPISDYFMCLGVKNNPSSRGDADASRVQETALRTQGHDPIAPEF